MAVSGIAFLAEFGSLHFTAHTADERAQMLYEAREKERRDNRAREQWALDEGLSQGKARD